MTGPSWGPDRTEEIRTRTPVDPWPAAEPAPAPAHRRVYGRVYELITGDRRDGAHPYVGQTTTTIHQRVHGSRGHTSPGSIAKDAWKARILPGKAGYRCLKVIYASGDPVADKLHLDMAEALAIDALHPTHNKQRPIRPAPAPAPRAAAATRPVSAREQQRRRRLTWARVRIALLLCIVAICTVLAARVAVAMQTPWPTFPWIVAPTVGLAVGWLVFWRAHRAVRKLTHTR